MSNAIQCPECLKAATRVIDSRPNYNRSSIARRRECVFCNYRWTTYEIDADRLDMLEESLHREAVQRRWGKKNGARLRD